MNALHTDYGRLKEPETDSCCAYPVQTRVNGSRDAFVDERRVHDKRRIGGLQRTLCNTDPAVGQDL